MSKTDQNELRIFLLFLKSKSSRFYDERNDASAKDVQREVDRGIETIERLLKQPERDERI